MKFRFVLAVTLFSASQLSFGMDSLQNVSSIHALADGSYSVVCENGASGIVSLDQIMDNRVCEYLDYPTIQPPKIQNMVSAVQVSTGGFHVICVGGSKEGHSIDSIRRGLPCLDVGKMVIGHKNAGNSFDLPPSVLFFCPVKVTKDAILKEWVVKTIQRTVDPNIHIGLYKSEGGNPTKLVTSSKPFPVNDIATIETFAAPAANESVTAGDYFLGFIADGSFRLALARNAAPLPSKCKSHSISNPNISNLPTEINPSNLRETDWNVPPTIYLLALPQ